MRKFVAIMGGVATVLAAAGVLAQAVPAPSPEAAPAPNGPDSFARHLMPRTQAVLDGYVRDGKMPGITAAFGFGDRPTLYLSAGRIADEPTAAPAGPDSLWRIYSMTKPVTAMAAMLLIEDGRLKLDDPLSAYFPAFRSMRVATSPETSLDSVPAKAPITIRMLMTHTAGLGYSISVKGPLLKEYERLGLIPAQLNASVETQARKTRPATLAAFAERAAQAPLIAEPGTKWSYSMGLDVLAAVVEKAGGMPFERFVQTRLLGPLKMTSTFWQVPAGDVGRFSTNYVFSGDGRSPIDPAATSVYLQPPSFPYGGAGLVSSAHDYDRFLHMLQDGGTLDGVRVMKPETAALAMSNLLPPGVVFGGLGAGTGGTMSSQMGFGAGGSVYLADAPGGAGKGTYGWGGAAGTIAFVDPARRARATIMVQYFPGEKWPVRQEVLAAMQQDLAALRAWSRGNQPGQ